MLSPEPKMPPRPAARSVVDEGMQQEIARALLSKDLAKEAAVKHSRHWVRLTRLCNQRCTFCLDSWNQNGTYIDTDQLLQYIDVGKRLGRERLILSGGEPTIHPDFVTFVRRGREVGYDWIQTVTNGMMFAYPKFTRKCIHAGLDEVTISIHGHNARLQDRLVGVKGAFDRAVQGIRNIQALSGGRTVINIDIVINRQNIEHLRDIIDFFMDMGIREYDLLYIVPFGRGFSEHRQQLYFDLDAHHDDLQRALAVSREPGVFIWTNRLPPEHLEGYEDLIQAPHKLHSEVQGGLPNFEGYLQRGTRPDCYGARCPHCFLRDMCRDYMFAYRERLVAGTFERVRVDLDVAVPSEAAAASLARQRPDVLHVQAADRASLDAWLATQPYGTAPELIVESRDETASPALLAREGVSRVVVATPAGLAAAVVTPPAEADLQVVLSPETARWLLAHPAEIAPWVEADKLVGALPNFEYVSEVRDRGVTPEGLAELRDAGLRLSNVAPCIGGARTAPGDHYELSRGMLAADGNLKLGPYVQRYILGEYYKKSVRCAACAVADTCRGMHIQFLRAFGFKALHPIDARTPVGRQAEVPTIDR